MRVSVIVPNYNYDRYIGRTVRSLLSQNFPRNDYEIIIADDGSTDNSLAVLQAYHSQLNILALPHKGQVNTCNEGFLKAQGQYVVRVDSDDYVNANFLMVESLLLEENKTFAAVCCDYWRVDEQENRVSRGDGAREPIACGVMFRREHLLEIGLYDKGISLWEERDLMQRFLPKYNVCHIPLPLYRYFQHNGSLTHK